MSHVQVKQGANINWQASWMVNRVLQDLTYFDIICQIRDTAGNLMVDFVVSKADQTTRKGVFSLAANGADTLDAHVGVHDCDIQYINQNSGQIEYTETFLVEFIKSISKAA